MRKLYFLFICAITFCMITISAEPRFYKANSLKVRCHYYIHDYLGQYEYAWDLFYGEMWTGNDTIVDGRHSVALWGREDGCPEKLLGCIYEDENGYVWRKEESSLIFTDNVLESAEFKDQWTFLDDFSQPTWNVGDSIEVCDHACRWNEHRTIRISDSKLSMVTLLNGESVPQYFTHVYGIGSIEAPLENDQVIGMSGITCDILGYWRNGVLLYAEEDTDLTSVDKNETAPLQSPTYDLLGRPTNISRSGFYIQGGRKVLIR